MDIPNMAEGQLKDSEKKLAWHRLSHYLEPTVPSPVSLNHAVVLIFGATYGSLYFCMGAVWLPPTSAVFAVLLLWSSALVVAEILSRTIGLPRVVGMVLSGMMWGNIPGTPVAAMPPTWGSLIRAAGLAMAFLRCGLELDSSLLKKFYAPTLALLFVPGLTETFYAAGIAIPLFQGMPPLLAISLGFILNAAGPGLVVPGMLSLQSRGYGTKSGVVFVPAMAASLDDFVAITGYSIFIHLAIVGQSNSAWDLAIGPVQIFIGAAAGTLGGCVLGCSKVFNTMVYRVLGLISFSLFIMYFLNHFNMLSGGGLASLTLSFVASHLWIHGYPRLLSTGPCTAYTNMASHAVSIFWSWVTEPLLFGTVMADVVFATMDRSIMSSAVIIIFTGMAVRFTVAFLSISLCRYSFRHALFTAVAWIPKATVQAALCSAPLTLIHTLKSGDPDYSQWVMWGKAIQVTGSLTIVFCGSLGTALIYKLGPILVERDEEAFKEAGLEPPIVRECAASSSMYASCTTQPEEGSLLDESGSGMPSMLALRHYFVAVDELLHLLDRYQQAPAAAAGGGRDRGGWEDLAQATARLSKIHTRLATTRPTTRQWLSGAAQQLPPRIDADAAGP